MTTVRLVVLAAIGFVALFLYVAPDFYGIRYTTSDDIDLQLYSLGPIRADSPWALAQKLAADQGRLTALFKDPVLAAVSSLRAPLLYTTLKLAAFFLAVGTVVAVIWWQIGPHFSWAFAIYFWCLFPQLWHHCPPSAYPVLPWLPIVAFGLATVALHRYVTTRRSMFFVLFVLAYTASLLFYEVFLLLLPPLAALIAYRLFAEHGGSRRSKLAVGATLLFVPAVYVLTYVLFRAQGGAYDGTSIAEFNPQRMSTTVFQLAAGSVSPFYLLRGTYEIYFVDALTAAKINVMPRFSLRDLLQQATWVDWSVALVASAGAVAFLRRAGEPTASPRPLFVAIAVGAFIAIASVLPYAITPKYQDWADGEHVAYFGSRYAYFGLILVLVASLALLFRPLQRHLPVRATVAVYAAVGIATAIAFVATSSFNERVSRTMRINAAKWQALEIASRCNSVREAMTGSTIVAPELWNRVWYTGIRSTDYWTTYAERVLGVKAAFLRDEGGSRTASSAYFGYRTDRHGGILAVFLATDYREGRASKVLLLTPRHLDIELRHKNGTGYELVHLNEGSIGASTCGRFLLTSLNAPSIDVGSLHFSAPYRAQLFGPRPGR